MANLYLTITYNKYANVYVNTIILNGIEEIGLLPVSVNTLQGSDPSEDESTIDVFPAMNVKKHANNSPAKYTNPFKSWLNIDDTEKKLTNINGAKRKVVYNNDT